MPPAVAQLVLGDAATRAHTTTANTDRVNSARLCSTSYSLNCEECATCGRPLSGEAALWWNKLDRYSQSTRRPRLRQCCSPTAQLAASHTSSRATQPHRRATALNASRQADSASKLVHDSDVSNVTEHDKDQHTEAASHVTTSPSKPKAPASAPSQPPAPYASRRTALFPAKEQTHIKDSWQTLMRWSKVFKKDQNGVHVLDKTQKVVVFGAGSFGTAMGVALARQRSTLGVSLLLRDPCICEDINTLHTNGRYLPVSLSSLHCCCQSTCKDCCDWHAACEAAQEKQSLR